ncbi:MAG: class I SAM-dependent methyltransferase, partial [Planctomycetota bacterium]|nr:class I SAM-dependent methyltransferase [Planctomycetota bacterium]
MKRVLHVVLALTIGIALQAQSQPPRPQRDGRLFPPQDLGLLEAPDRDIWQHPDQIMDVLGVADASVVADVGAGSGWFTIRLARRVGPNGIVYAQDVQPEMLAAIDRRVKAEGLLNVKLIRGEGADPRLPKGAVHAVLLVDAYHEIVDRVTMLRNLAKALRPEGRIGVIDFK